MIVSFADVMYRIVLKKNVSMFFVSFCIISRGVSVCFRFGIGEGNDIRN